MMVANNHPPVFDKWLRYESGQAWCEASYAKYSAVPWVAEFSNTASTLPIIVLPLLNAMMLREYIEVVNFNVLIPHLLLTFNGLASSYYHATLNLFGQLVDEVSIIWLLNSCVFAFLPTFRSWPYELRNQVNSLRFGLTLFTSVVSVLCFIEPSMNAFALMLFTFPGIALIYMEGYKSEINEAKTLAVQVFKLWSFALMFWLMDKLMCDIWLFIGTPYLHAIFHLLSSVAGYNVFLMFAIVDIERRKKRLEHNFSWELRHFPSRSNNHWFSFAYIRLTNSTSVCKVQKEESLTKGMSVEGRRKTVSVSSCLSKSSTGSPGHAYLRQCYIS